MSLGAILKGAGQVGSALLGFAGGERANRINQREAALNRSFQAGEAATNRSFQEKMRSTEWQTAVADMEAAGINPALAYSQGGASSPGGSMAGGTSTAGAVDSVSSAIQAMATRKNLQLLDEQIRRTQEETKRTRFEARSSGLKADFDTARYQYFFTPEGMVKQPLLDILNSEVQTSKASGARAMSEAELARLSVPERKAIAGLFERTGEGGKAAQILLPLLSTLIRR